MIAKQHKEGGSHLETFGGDEPSVVPKKVHQSGSHHLDNLDKQHNKPSKGVSEHANVSKETPASAVKNYHEVEPCRQSHVRAGDAWSPRCMCGGTGVQICGTVNTRIKETRGLRTSRLKFDQ